MAGAGLKKCRPSTGRPVVTPAAISETRSDEVLVASGRARERAERVRRRLQPVEHGEGSLRVACAQPHREVDVGAAGEAAGRHRDGVGEQPRQQALRGREIGAHRDGRLPGAIEHGDHRCPPALLDRQCADR
jgi:hypothetical protein